MKLPRFKLFFKEVLKVTSFYKLRTFFSIISVAMGICCVALTISSMDGANKVAREIFEILGADTIFVFGKGESKKIIREKRSSLTWSDFYDLKRIEGVHDIIPLVYFGGVIAKYRNKKWQTLLIGTTPNYFSVFSWYPREGIIFGENDVLEGGALFDIGKKVKDELFGDESPLGKTIVIGKVCGKVLGVLCEKGGAFGKSHLDDRIIAPISFVMKRVKNETKYIDMISLKVSGDIYAREKDVEKVLLKNHHIKDRDQKDFSIKTSKEVIRMLSVVSGTLFLFLGTCALISLVVGGFVLANLFFLSVYERKREIGIRRAFGAEKNDILFQFLAESVVLTMFGGLLGLILAYISSPFMSKLLNIPMEPSIKIILSCFLFSLATGLLSGFRPARKASSIQPIEAIRG